MRMCKEMGKEMGREGRGIWAPGLLDPLLLRRSGSLACPPGGLSA